MSVSGKLVILAVLAVAVSAAAASWWFRYAATNQAARFWGRETTRLIRDAPRVELYRSESVPSEAFETRFAGDILATAHGRNISHLPGLTHLRHALLEDRSFQWPPEDAALAALSLWVLVFRDELREESAILIFSRDWSVVTSADNEALLSCRPIATGLREMLGALIPPENEQR